MEPAAEPPTTEPKQNAPPPVNVAAAPPAPAAPPSDTQDAAAAAAGLGGPGFKTLPSHTRAAVAAAVLTHEPHNAALVAWASGVVLSVAADRVDHRIPVAEVLQGDATVLIAALCIHAADRRVVEAVLAALHRVTAPLHTTAVPEAAGAVPAVMAALKTHGVSTIVSWAACGLLSDIVRDSITGADRVCEAGGVAAILAALAAHPGSGDVVLNAAAALANLAATDHQTQSSIIAGGGVQALLGALHHFKANEKVAGWCLRALRYVCMGSAGACAAVLHHNYDGGSLALLRRVMQQHYTSLDVTESGCWLLEILATTYSSHSHALATPPVLAALAEAVATHGAGSDSVCRAAVLVINSLTSPASEAVLAAVAEHGGIAITMAAMRAQPDHTIVAQWGAKSLTKLATGSQSRAEAIAAGGGILLLAAAAARFQDNPQVKPAVAAALAAIAAGSAALAVAVTGAQGGAPPTSCGCPCCRSR